MTHPKRTAAAPFAALILGLCAALPAQAQNTSSQGQNWSSAWGFSSATDRSVALNRAQVMHQVEEAADPTTTYYTYNTQTTDNRSNYNQTDVLGDGATSVEVIGGDKIGQKTYSVGSLNTGSTQIDIIGTGNTVDANNSATTNGCVDGSISDLTFQWTPTDGSAGPSGSTPSTSSGGWDMSSGSIGSGCQ